MKETFEENKPEWKFTKDVVNYVSELKRNLIDYLPGKYKQLTNMSVDNLLERRKLVAQSVVKILFASADNVNKEDTITIKASELSDSKKEYLWQSLHELELIDVIERIISGFQTSCFISDFNNTEITLRQTTNGKEINFRVLHAGRPMSLSMGLED